MNGLGSRIVVREHSKSNTDWAGENYERPFIPNSIPTPYGDRNTYDASNIEDLLEIQEYGRYSANSVVLPVNYSKEIRDKVETMKNKVYDVLVLIGADGEGSDGVLGFTATFDGAIDEINDELFLYNVTVGLKTQPTWLDKKYTVEVTEDEFGSVTNVTVTKSSAV